MLIALMFNMAILALPLFAAVAAGRFACDTRAGVPGAIAVGFVEGAAALGVGQAILVTRSTLVAGRTAGEDWFCFAGLWRPAQGDVPESFTLLTTEPGSRRPLR